ncbi:hypothetical protein PS2_029378 [Malus domestica]
MYWKARKGSAKDGHDIQHGRANGAERKDHGNGGRTPEAQVSHWSSLSMLISMVESLMASKMARVLQSPLKWGSIWVTQVAQVAGVEGQTF